MPNLTVGPNVTYSCADGGTLTTLGEAGDLLNTGIQGGWAYYDDIYVNTPNDMTMNVSNHTTRAVLSSVVGEMVLSFYLSSSVPNGKADIRFENLLEGEYYRLVFDGEIAQTAGGRAHGMTTPDGELLFTGVEINYE